MKKFYRNSTFVAAMVASMFLLGSCEKELDDTNLSAISVSEASSVAETAQSIMIDIDVDAPIIEENGDIWKFNKEAASQFFKGGTDNERKSAAQKQRCTFFNGGVLQSESNGSGKKGVEPISTNPVEPKTAWYEKGIALAEDGTNVSEVAVNITIAGQSVVVNKGRAKYSFTLLDKDGNPRISDLKVQVNSQKDILNPAFEVTVGDETNNCLADVLYKGNAGDFGRAKSYILTDMTMGEIIAMNAFSSTSACGNASIAKVEPLKYNLSAGTYTITVTGIVKGNAGMASAPFTVTKSVTVSDKCTN